MPFDPAHTRVVHLDGLLHGMRRHYGHVTEAMRQDAEARADRAVRMAAALEDELLKIKAEIQQRKARPALAVAAE